MKTVKKSEYDVQAEKFVADTSITIAKAYTGYRIYFDGDKERRSCWLITVKRAESSFSYDFGQSIAKSFKARNREGVHFMQNAKDFAQYSQSVLNKRDISEVSIAPSDYDLLACMSSDSYQADSFDDWCANFGYDTDSRKALETYLKCEKIASDINNFFTADELEQLQEIQ